ncbi:hypothetical protein [Kroppenstedtia eburnea]|uniref:Uncharacterized protein n=1 Tax=Kroppenstedtia eburnea TaxID=714067 RepID=A0A1N7IQZ0_9BACL|nr:hypothetical protein [Kroppenstedtia eburnea]QKI82095.1 hypothetical protein GXN75_08815 [Kroppenstedtia eburnea]SIS39401.1 hypothetical protein SAMN05421790_101245 [Kroppenstedtia eburnea]
MEQSWKQTLIQTLLVTVIAVNMMWIGLLVARNRLEPAGTAPVMGRPGTPASQKEVRLQYEGVTSEGEWEVEHYRTIEILRDEKGREIQSRPTGEETHLRYWKGDRS